jgi:putative transposase
MSIKFQGLPGRSRGHPLFSCVVFEKTPWHELSMPRSARIDASGALHHVIGRGIERRKIFWGDCDRDDFSERLERILRETQTPCSAWAMLPNHFPLRLRTGNIPIAGV